jgi:hypothetical protein
VYFFSSIHPDLLPLSSLSLSLRRLLPGHEALTILAVLQNCLSLCVLLKNLSYPAHEAFRKHSDGIRTELFLLCEDLLGQVARYNAVQNKVCDTSERILVPV